MALSKPYDVRIWTSSHGTHYHGFPEQLEIAFYENYHPQRNTFLKLPTIDAQSGRLTNLTFLEKFKDDFDQIRDEENRINILVMGDNDVRCMGYAGASRVERQVGRLIELHKGTRHALLICGLLPSPATHNVTKALFDTVSSHLSQKAQLANTSADGRFICYLQLSHIFNDREGFIDADRFFKRDRVHLSPDGAFRLAQHLVHNTITIIETFLESSLQADVAYLDLSDSFLYPAEGEDFEASNCSSDNDDGVVPDLVDDARPVAVIPPANSDEN